MVTELPNVNLRFAIERQGALPGRTSLLINRQSTNANRKSFIQPGAKPAAKKPIRHGAWLTEVVKQRRPETATFPCGKPSRAALGEPSPEIYSTAGRDSSANIGDFPLQNALNNRKRGICASRVASGRSGLLRSDLWRKTRGRPTLVVPALDRRAGWRFALGHRASTHW